jgi:hypothetical protein
MQFDIFFSICQNSVSNFMPDELTMFRNFFDQVLLADKLGFDTAWIAETHLSSEVQKKNPNAVVPHFEGEIGLNTDIFQLAHRVFTLTENIHVGSAIRNILCNGGPIAHVEALKTFMLLHSLRDQPQRLLHLGFASGRFPYSNQPYGIFPRNPVEECAWPVLKGKVFRSATEIFLRLLKERELSQEDIEPIVLKPSHFRSSDDWKSVENTHGSSLQELRIPHFWNFDNLGVIPFESPLDSLRLIVGSHDPELQEFANNFFPVGVFNLSITPSSQIEKTHQHMNKCFHPSGGPWKTEYMPRTVLIFLEDDPTISEKSRNKQAQEKAKETLSVYWKAMQGTIDPEKISQTVDNALVGSPHTICEQLQSRFHKDERLMLWFDLNNHDNDRVKKDMRSFMEKISPKIT